MVTVSIGRKITQEMAFWNSRKAPKWLLDAPPSENATKRWNYAGTGEVPRAATGAL